MCFIDYSKAFDCVDHSTLWNMMEEMDIPEHMVQVIRSLYAYQEAKVRTEYGDTESFFDWERCQTRMCSPAGSIQSVQ